MGALLCIARLWRAVTKVRAVGDVVHTRNYLGAPVQAGSVAHCPGIRPRSVKGFPDCSNGVLPASLGEGSRTMALHKRNSGRNRSERISLGGKQTKRPSRGHPG